MGPRKRLPTFQSHGSPRIVRPQATPVAGRYYPFWSVLSEKGEKLLTNRGYVSQSKTPSKEDLYLLAYLRGLA